MVLRPRICESSRMARESHPYPPALDPARVGTYPALTKTGGGFVWDEVLEYRVWCSPHRGAPDEADGNDYYFVFETYDAALTYARQAVGAEEPLALVLQREYIDEPEPGQFVHVRDERITEWPVEFLTRPRRTDRTIPDFLAPDAPASRLDILRGVAPETPEDDGHTRGGST